MNTLKILETMHRTGLIPVFYHEDADLAAEVVHSCYEGGCRVFEFTNRGKQAPAVFEKLVELKEKKMPELILGVGTIMSPMARDNFISLGAEFTVSPVLHDELVSRNQFHIPGCGSVTEVDRAWENGADLVKLFPANVLGPGFIKSLHGPMPDIRIMPSGGVYADRENLKSWFEAGAYCVGMGSPLFSSDIIDNRKPEKLEFKVAEILSIIAEVRNG
ncbi:MAG: bifunctional 4-hydroxy-2-oxoglutarate aldolase/2-dehydro-3-deoxy-phosphogluconate aldolase [Cyclobacteriaceae bacterium]